MKWASPRRVLMRGERPLLTTVTIYSSSFLLWCCLINSFSFDFSCSLSLFSLGKSSGCFCLYLFNSARVGQPLSRAPSAEMTLIISFRDADHSCNYHPVNLWQVFGKTAFGCARLALTAEALPKTHRDYCV